MTLLPSLHPEPHPSRNTQRTTRLRRWAWSAFAALAIAPLGHLHAQQSQSAPAFPSKHITIVSAGGPGGVLEMVARLIGEELQKNTGQPVVVESKPGANGIVAINRLKQSPADGHTVMLGLSQVLQNLIVQDNVSYKLTDFAPITMMAIHPIVLASSAGNKDKTLRQVLSDISSRQGGGNFASNGTGSVGHIIGNLLAKAENVKIMHLAYQGEGAMFIALTRSDVDGAFVSPSGLKPHADAGKLRGLAVTGTQRLKGYEGMPTFAELGHPELSALTGWSAFFALADTPEPVVQQLYTELEKAMRSPSVTKKLEEMYYIPDLRKPSAFKTFLNEDLARWQSAIRRAGPLN